MKIHNLLILFFLLVFASCNSKKEVANEDKSLIDLDGNISFTDSAGNAISKEELSKSTGNFNYQIHGIGNVPQSAQVLHNEARAFGQAGDYKSAIEKLQKAHEEAPNWAYPPYDLAYTYLLQDDYENALKYYQLTDKIEPKGFYTSKIALHTLGREMSGDLKEGVYKSYISLEWIDNEAEKKEITKMLVSTFPDFAPGWNKYAVFLEGKERMDALEKGLSLDSDIQTKGSLLINKALSLSEVGNHETASEILMKIIFDSASTFGNIELAKFALNNISENK
ncbi:MAG: tetratricopeptide (TPR) repeat protein [Arenicella sp.]|jgi:tetratricopeptide (TPR) repeat protein